MDVRAFVEVQHLIEKCLTYHMTKEECVEALSRHAYIQPLITSTVWNELEKENKEFFESYARSLNEEQETKILSEAKTIQLIQNTASASGKSSPPLLSPQSPSSPSN